MYKNKIKPGLPTPLGNRFDGKGTNFALYSASAQRVELCLFSHDGKQEIARHELPSLTDDVWHGYLEDIKPGSRYGYRVYGDYDPTNGNWFNANKLLIDPFCRELSGEIINSDLLYAYANAQDPFDGQADQRDNAHVMAKCVVSKAPTTTLKTKPFRGFDDDYHLIYEAHCRGLTKLQNKLPADLRGTYKSLAHDWMIDYFKRVNISAIELLPVHSFITEPYLTGKGLTNYWGYNSINFFALQQDYAYSPENVTDEFSQMVQRLHDNQIELILDVVYNHTAEGDQHGPMLSFKGIDNKTYYRLTHENRYVNHSGCGNTLNLANKHVLEMVMSSLRYWAQIIGVDGFRFDLATTLARDEHDRFNTNCTFFNAVRQDSVLKNVKLIAEPWDIGIDGHQTGQFPAPWSQWNDNYRDCMRAFWRGDSGELARFADALLASSQRFEHSTHARRPWASLNILTTHDGFTLNDLVSFTNKHNQANGEDNRDGHNHNLSTNHGHEGKTGDDAINHARAKHRRNLLATLYCSQGIPMLLAGDEFGNSQQGNNNAYCQDNPISWLNWDEFQDNEDIFKFCAYLGKLRKSHSLLRHRLYIHHDNQADKSRVPLVQWLKLDATNMHDHDWHNSQLKSLVLMLSAHDRPNVDYKGAESILLLFNREDVMHDFSLDRLDIKRHWKVVIDTDKHRVSEMQYNVDQNLSLQPNSMILAINNS